VSFVTAVDILLKKCISLLIEAPTSQQQQPTDSYSAQHAHQHIYSSDDDDEQQQQQSCSHGTGSEGPLLRELEQQSRTAAGQARIADSLLGAFRVLINMSHHNSAACDALRGTGCLHTLIALFLTCRYVYILIQSVV
jgi:hypothetical protein